ncbi:hypothetical protein OIU79_014166 [Salix purpurea]|uniref:Uncharacterized protein n=1 Tax=Salix purpurea TaxID=77065 RepID=A0A9Q0SW81_SALPP|nr:hypothetical protein OIU79_014166 [Salix purpurea]
MLPWELPRLSLLSKPTLNSSYFFTGGFVAIFHSVLPNDFSKLLKTDEFLSVLGKSRLNNLPASELKQQQLQDLPEILPWLF